MAQAKVCTDLTSMSSITFRLLDCFTIGTCVVGPPRTTQLQFPFEDRAHLAYCREDYSDLEEVCAYYVDNEEARLQLVRNSRTFFDAYIHREQLATYYLHHCVEMLK